MEQPKRKVARYNPEEIFYSDSEDEQGLQATIEASGQVKTVFRLGHAVGTQELQNRSAKLWKSQKTCPEQLTRWQMKSPRI